MMLSAAPGRYWEPWHVCRAQPCQPRPVSSAVWLWQPGLSLHPRGVPAAWHLSEPWPGAGPLWKIAFLLSMSSRVRGNPSWAVWCQIPSGANILFMAARGSQPHLPLLCGSWLSSGSPRGHQTYQARVKPWLSPRCPTARLEALHGRLLVGFVAGECSDSLCLCKDGQRWCGSVCLLASPAGRRERAAGLQCPGELSCPSSVFLCGLSPTLPLRPIECDGHFVSAVCTLGCRCVTSKAR